MRKLFLAIWLLIPCCISQLSTAQEADLVSTLDYESKITAAINSFDDLAKISTELDYLLVSVLKGTAIYDDIRTITETKLQHLHNRVFSYQETIESLGPLPDYYLEDLAEYAESRMSYAAQLTTVSTDILESAIAKKEAISSGDYDGFKKLLVRQQKHAADIMRIKIVMLKISKKSEPPNSPERHIISSSIQRSLLWAEMLEFMYESQTDNSEYFQLRLDRMVKFSNSYQRYLNMAEESVKGIRQQVPSLDENIQTPVTELLNQYQNTIDLEFENRNHLDTYISILESLRPGEDFSERPDVASEWQANASIVDGLMEKRGKAEVALNAAKREYDLARQ